MDDKLRNKKIFLMSKENLKNRLGAFPYSSYHKDNIIRDYDMFLNYIINNNHAIKHNMGEIWVNESDIDDIVKGFLETKHSATYKNLSRCCLKAIFYLNNLPFDREKYPITNYAESKNIEGKITTYNEFINELDNLFNESEKLISYMAFKNLLGADVINARMAKESDVDFEKGEWKLYDGRVIKLDDPLLVTLLKNTIKQTEYIPYDKKDKLTENGVHMPESYEYNTGCEYLFKTRNHPRSGNGLNPFQRVGIETPSAYNNSIISVRQSTIFSSRKTYHHSANIVLDIKKEVLFKVLLYSPNIQFLL